VKEHLRYFGVRLVVDNPNFRRRIGGPHTMATTNAQVRPLRIRDFFKAGSAIRTGVDRVRTPETFMYAASPVALNLD
jgi:hypothetical protein